MCLAILITIALWSLPVSADISRSDFIAQLDSSKCSAFPERLYLNTDIAHFDMANALSLSWIALATIPGESMPLERLEDEWNVRNVVMIDNEKHDMRIMVADYKDTVLVTFRHTNSNQNWLYDADYGLWRFESSFTLGEKVHHGFGRMLESEWQTLVDEVRLRAQHAEKVWVFGHSLGGSLAQLASAGLAYEGLPVDRVYLTGSPKVGSKKWVKKARNVMNARTFRQLNKNDLVSRLPIHHTALDEFGAIFSLIPGPISSAVGKQRNRMKFDLLGESIEIVGDGRFYHWSETYSVKSEQNYWLQMKEELSNAGQGSDLFGSLKEKAGVLVRNLEDHLLRDDKGGYFCSMIDVLKQE